MRLAEKLAHLRQVEGQVRGLGRPLTKAEVVRAMQAELGAGMSHAYLSQLESGRRVHLSAGTRDLLARFFKVHPGYLVDDPPGYQAEITTAALLEQDNLGAWLANRAEEQRSNPLVRRFLRRLARADNPRRYLALFDELLGLPLDELERAVREGFGPGTVARRPAKLGREARLERDLQELKQRLGRRADGWPAARAPS